MSTFRINGMLFTSEDWSNHDLDDIGEGKLIPEPPAGSIDADRLAIRRAVAAGEIAMGGSNQPWDAPRPGDLAGAKQALAMTPAPWRQPWDDDE